MAYLEKTSLEKKEAKKIRFYKKTWFKIAVPIIIILLLIGGFFAFKAGYILNKISSGGILSSIVHSLPGAEDTLKGEEEDRINVLLLGMRGASDPAGGTLADTIILVSIKPKESKLSMISIPRDLYVTVPGTSDRQKINAVHAYGEENGQGKGLENMKIAVGEVTGQAVHYAARIDFAGFKQLIDAIGGIEITLEQPFQESMQYREEHVCDSNVFTVPSGNWEIKKSGRTGKIKAQYPLCYPDPKYTECGGDFKLPAGKQTLDGEKALCFARSRKTSSDFERAKRQQLVIQLVKDKLTSVGTLADFGKLNGILDSLGDNVKTDMQPWEMKKLYDLYSKMSNSQVYQRVLENSEEGLLYSPQDSGGAGYILLPIGDNYDKIRDMARNIFTMPAQSDIKPKP